MDQNKASTFPINREQKRIMLDYVQTHPELATQKFSKDFTFKKAQQQWEEVTNMLNSVPGGSKKDWRKWRKTWTDMKKNAKMKASEIKKYSQGTGGGPTIPKEKEVSDIEKGILEIIGKVVQSGHEDITETPVDFQFDVPNEINSLETDVHEDVQIIYSEEVESPHSSVHLLLNVEKPIAGEPGEHNYSISKTNLTPSNAGGNRRKSQAATKRLETSQKISAEMLNTMEKRTTSMDCYHEQKVLYFEHLKQYHNEKIYLLKENNTLISELLKDIKELKTLLLAHDSFKVNGF